MAERLYQVPQSEVKKAEQVRRKDGSMPGEDRWALENMFRGGGGWNGFTKKIQYGGALLAFPFSAGLSGILLAGGLVDGETQHYTDQWAAKKEKERQEYIEQRYGQNKVVVKGKVLDRYAYESAKQAPVESPKEGAKIFDLGAFRRKKAAEAAAQSRVQNQEVVFDLGEHRSRRQAGRLSLVGGNAA